MWHMFVMYMHFLYISKYYIIDSGSFSKQIINKCIQIDLNSLVWKMFYTHKIILYIVYFRLKSMLIEFLFLLKSLPFESMEPDRVHKIIKFVTKSFVKWIE